MKRLFLLGSAAVLGITAAGCHSPSGGQGTVPPQTPAPAISAPPAPPGKIVAYVLNPKATGDKDLLMPREVTETPSKEPARDAVSALLHSSRSPIAPGTSLRGISISDGLARVDFSQSPVSSTGGEDAQSAGLNALAMTLGQFPEIKSFQVEVKGRPLNSFGEFTADGPMDVIRPGDQPASDARKLTESSGQ